MMTEYCQIQTTVANREEADALAGILVNGHLAACVQIISIVSTYRWQGEIQHEPEMLLLIKTRRSLYQKVETVILKNHRYQLPEVVCVPIEAGLDRYLAWIEANTKS